MEHLYNPLYTKLYKQGYTFGLNPVFSDCETFSKIGPKYNNEAFLCGFESGRSEYERLNGLVADGIPKRIVTRVVEHVFFLLGLTGLRFAAFGYTKYQSAVLERSYRNGLGLYNADNDIELYLMLSEHSIII
jgi:hypothetical protein